MTDGASQLVRPIVRVTDDDRVAAMQILACIARPHSDRATSAGELMQQWFWARQRHRREGFPPELAVPVPDKDRIAPKLKKLAEDIDHALTAGEWLKLQWAAKSAKRNGVVVKGVSLGALAARKWNRDNKEKLEEEGGEEEGGWIKSTDDQASPVRQKIWIKRRPVVHMALAVREEARERHGGLPKELEALVFDTSWVASALKRSETYAAVAIEHNILEPGEPWRFIR